jgi:hypothetical protein
MILLEAFKGTRSLPDNDAAGVAKGAITVLKLDEPDS